MHEIDLCNYNDERVNVHVRAYIENGCLTLIMSLRAMCDILEVTVVIYRKCLRLVKG